MAKTRSKSAINNSKEEQKQESNLTAYQSKAIRKEKKEEPKKNKKREIKESSTKYVSGLGSLIKS